MRISGSVFFLSLKYCRDTQAAPVQGRNTVRVCACCFFGDKQVRDIFLLSILFLLFLRHETMCIYIYTFQNRGMSVHFALFFHSFMIKIM